MLDSGSESSSPQRDIPCKLVVGRFSTKAHLSELHYDRAELTAPNLPQFITDGIFQIEAEGLGAIDARFRWRVGETIGVELL